MSDVSPAVVPEPAALPDAAPLPRRGGAPAVIALWLTTRVASMLLFVAFERQVAGDIVYYWRSVGALGQVGLSDTLREYPTPVVWFLSLPQVAGGSRNGYVVAFIGLMMLLDAGLTYALWRGGGRRHSVAIDFWIAYVFLVGPLCYARFDMVPAALVAWALMAARTRPWLTGALTGLGAAIKLWPALLAAAFATRRRGRGQMLGAFVVVGFGLAALSLAVGGRARLFSPLTWQSGRGLQIESVWATPLLLARLSDHARWQVHYSAFKAYELFGPGVSTWLTVSTAATVVGLLVTLVLVVRGFRCRDVTPVGLGLLVLATVAITTLTNKTLSPQYLLWMGGPAAVLLLSLRSEGPRWTRVIGRVAITLVATALLTQLTYPVLYDGLLGRAGATRLVVATVVASLRNLSVLVLTIVLCASAWSALGRPRPS